MNDKLKLSEYLESLQGTYEENMPWDELIELAKGLEQDLEIGKEYRNDTTSVYTIEDNKRMKQNESFNNSLHLVN